jgi:hypothetical protein
MNYETTLGDNLASLYFHILARRAAIHAEIQELVRQIQEIALHLEALQQHRRGSYTENVAKAFGITPAAAISEQRNLRALAKQPISKSFFVVNGMLPAPLKKTPKKAKPASSIGRIGALQAEVLKAKERGLNPQEAAIIRDMVEQLRKTLQ